MKSKFKMKERFLTTTAIENTWYKDRPLLFLGEWCKIYDRHYVWEGIDSITVPYHWDDRRKLYIDYLYLQQLYEELLSELADKLNEIHSTDYSLRYWRILVGPWLFYFIGILFDRWEMIKKANSDFSIAGVKILEIEPAQVVPNDMAEFNDLITKDAWNEVIYGELIRDWTNISIEKVQSDQSFLQSNVLLKLNPTKWLKHKLFDIVSAFTQISIREDEAFLYASYLPIYQNVILQLQLKQLPKIWKKLLVPQVAVRLDQRQWKIGKSKLVDFPAIIRAMIPRHIPIIYLEGYNLLNKISNSLNWPKKPSLIFTSNSFFSDDVFKVWSAEKAEKGVPFIIGQHGGSYGMSPIAPLEEHEYAISDIWLSWGWSDKNRPQIKPVFNLKLVGAKQSWDPDGKALMVEMLIPRYSYRLLNFPIADQWLNYFADQCRFVNALPIEIRRKLIVRLSNQDYGWKQKKRWYDNYPNINLDIGEIPIAKLLKKTRIYISTYNATTFLESMSMNIPTIMFWNQYYFEIRDSAIPYFEQLKIIGIFHETPESAARQMTKVWDDVGKWWNSKPVQDVREEFCYQYSRMPEKPLNKLRTILQNIAKVSID